MTFSPTLKKERKRSSQEGVWDGKNEAIAREWLQFSLFHRGWIFIDFGLLFGVVVGAKFATILIFGRPGGQNRVTKERATTATLGGEMRGVGPRLGI